MRRQGTEWVPGDRAMRLNMFIILAAYTLLLIWLEPLIDFILSLDPIAADPFSLAELNRRKLLYSALALAAARTLPIGLLFWLGYRTIASAGFPPGRMKFPFTVQRLKGSQARLFGLLFIGASLFLVYWEMVQLSRVLFT